MATTLRLSRIDEPPPVAKVTDVRQLAMRLGTCASCGGTGDKRRLLSLVSIGIAGLHHGTCAVKVLTPEQILALPCQQTEKLRLNETGVELMKQLLDREI